MLLKRLKRSDAIAKLLRRFSTQDFDVCLGNSIDLHPILASTTIGNFDAPLFKTKKPYKSIRIGIQNTYPRYCESRKER
jgi:hypothetical protein